MTKDFILGKCEYKMDKLVLKEGACIQHFADLIYKPDSRLKWDSSVKTMKKIIGSEEKDIENNDKYLSYVVHTHMYSPVFFISERDVLEKRTEFYHNEIYYSFSSSVDDTILPPESGVVRCKSFVNIYIITEDEKYFHFMSFNQVDPKMNFPESFYNMMLPFKVTGFYKTLADQVNGMLP